MVSRRGTESPLCRERAPRRLLATAMLGSESFAAWLKGVCASTKDRGPKLFCRERDAPHERMLSMASSIVIRLMEKGLGSVFGRSSCNAGDKFPRP